ncbi:crotonase/enoyl-CoA hydratase family protein [Pacificimonas sp. WHA3]|uniref:Crotonase/enoyl-CoA hydratase family protein n=1 Tax=Pacificimonas pallii TaxID=2827236 RepID=A0ABS6SGD5_9SPHN|nr:crotonase/enoyl-CoA hydratase family protein [Pacificimonas pallii]MBV7257325.1 crotonase/enoyl-CoA hydratase family protein [Pacificimonas pallii]
MQTETISLEIAEHIAHVKLTRPDELNTMTPAFWEDMISVFEAIDADPAVRAVVLSSTGRHFTAGLDLKSAQSLHGDPKDVARERVHFLKHVKRLQHSFTVIDECRVPVIAVIQGGCIGGGVDLVTACDMRIIAEGGWFSVQEINVGIVADVGTLQRIPHLLPQGIVRELAYTGRRFPADEAKSYGFVNAVAADHEAALASAMALAKTIAQKSPVAMMGTKAVLNRGRGQTVEAGLDYVAVWNAAFLQGEDMREAIGAQMQKREPAFKNIA